MRLTQIVVSEKVGDRMFTKTWVVDYHQVKLMKFAAGDHLMRILDMAHQQLDAEIKKERKG